jgi:hypothetical protein
MQLLNCAQGKKMLNRLDQAAKRQAAKGQTDPDYPGSFVDNDIPNRKIEADITGDWYGFDKGVKKKIMRASCQTMKLGEDVLWIHTSYPCKFAA